MQTLDDINKINPTSDAHDFYKFQGEACTLLKEALPQSKTLLGFVGAPLHYLVMLLKALMLAAW